MQSPTQQLADALIDGGIREFIASRRAGDKPTSWRKIAMQLHEATGGQVSVTPETVRTWHSQITPQAAA